LAESNNTIHARPRPSTPTPSCLNDAGRRTPDAGLSCAAVVASFKPGHLIDRCLHSLLAQQGIADLQIVVVDSSANGTAERLQRDFPTVEVIGLAQQTPQSIARNIGVARTHAPFVAITDHDCVVPPDWLVRLLARHREGEYAVVGGAVGNGTPTSAIGTASYLIEFNEFLPAGRPRLVTMVPHCNVCFRREVFTTVGPFVAVPPGAEDLVFNFLICQQGGRILFDPAIVVEHINRTAFLRFLRHQRLLGFGSAVARQTVALRGQIFVRHPSLIYSLPLVRLVRTVARLAASNRLALLRYLGLLPILLPGHLTWTLGFRTGLRKAPPMTSLEPGGSISHPR
jgi:GT2 family glycosyltransferase